MIEYEYNFKVSDIKPIIEYCKENGYNFVSATWQNRKVFENSNNKNIISRITTTKINNKLEIVWDFKNVDNKNKTLKISQESLPMSIDKQKIEIVLSMLNTIGFELSADNIRTRYVYEKDNVVLEIDDYERPAMKIVAIEGQKDKVDQLYQQITSNKQLCKTMGAQK